MSHCHWEIIQSCISTITSLELLLCVCLVVSDSLQISVACQAPLSMGLSRQEYWNGLPFPSQGDLPNSWIQPGLLHWQVDSFTLSHLGGQKCDIYIGHKNIYIYLFIKSITFYNNEKNPPFSPVSPRPLCLGLYSCPADRPICTIFLGSTYEY